MAHWGLLCHEEKFFLKYWRHPKTNILKTELFFGKPVMFDMTDSLADLLTDWLTNQLTE